jgi:alpha-1,6-mannosyltransferase
VSRGLPEQRALAGLGTLSGLLYLTTAVPLVSVRGGALAVYLIVFPLLFGIYLAAVWVVRRQPRPAEPLAGPRWSTSLATILGFGLLFRVLLLPTPVYLSSDPYRYFWDGRVQLAGINPYRYPPAAPELAALRDGDVHPNINRPGSRTIYPPGAQWIFALAAAAGVRTVLAWRVLVLAAEAVTVTSLLALLRRFRLPETAVLVYVWSPLVVFEGVQAGHLDLLMVPLVLLALLWRGQGAATRAGVALGLAVLVKLYPVVLALAWSARREGQQAHGSGIVMWWRSRDWRFLAAVGATVALGYAPYVWAIGAGALGFLPEYFGVAEDHNIGLRALLTWGLGFTSDVDRTTVIAILFVVLLGALVWIGRGAAGAALDRTGAAAIGAYLALVPTAMHPWYVVWIVPFLCLAPSPAWLHFSGAVSLSYVAYLVAPAPLPAWAWLAQYGPLFGLLAVEARRSRAARPAVAVMARTT